VSIWHPSSLPTWDQFNGVLLDEARRRALLELEAGSSAATTLRELTIGDIESKAFSQMLVQLLAGDVYFDVVLGLEGDAPNPAHRAIAALAAKGRIGAVVTTNFDTLLERACREIGLRPSVFSSRADYLKPPEPGCQIHKIHGSAAPGSTLVDTVGQKIRGLPAHLRSSLEALYRRGPLVILGYSGGDLEFGADYLGMRSIPVGTDWIRWVCRPGEEAKVPGIVHALLAGRGRVVSLEQRELLESLGAGPIALEWNAASRVVVLQRLRDLVAQMFDKLDDRNVLAFCMRLLSVAGRTAAAETIWRQLDRQLVGGGQRSTAARVALPTMVALAGEGHRLKGVQAQAMWACRTLGAVAGLRTVVGAKSLSLEGRISHEKSLETVEAAAALDLADAAVRRGDYEAAGRAMLRAMEISELLGSLSTLADVYRAFGWRAAERVRRGRDFRRDGGDWRNPGFVAEMRAQENEALGYLLAAEATGVVGGNVAALVSAALRADFLVELGEYDAAVACVERLEDRLGFGLHRETRVELQLIRGDVQLRQGKPHQALATWQGALTELAAGSPVLEAGVKTKIVSWLGYETELRPLVLQLCDEVLAAMARKEIPADKRIDLIKTDRYFETVRRNLTALGDRPLEPMFMRELVASRSNEEFSLYPEHFVRQALIAHEFRGNTPQVLSRLDQLVALKYWRGTADGTVETAKAHLKRAREQGDLDHIFWARANMAAAHDRMGDEDGWRSVGGDLLADERAQDPRTRAALTRRLPHDLWFQIDEHPHTARHAFARDATIDILAAVALDRTRPATGIELEEAARAAFSDSHFVMGRLFAMEGMEAYHAESRPEGANRCRHLLAEAAARDVRSDPDLFGICEQMRPLWANDES
jgi:hypothetical protein